MISFVWSTPKNRQKTLIGTKQKYKIIRKIREDAPKGLTPKMIEKIDIIKRKIDDQHKVKLQRALLRSKLPSFEKNELSLAFF